MNKTILKWAGSKARIIDKLQPYLPNTKRLIEPFGGSCAVMMNTDYERYLIADNNGDLINLYMSLIRDPKTVISIAKGVFISGNTEEQYYYFRSLFNEGQLKLSWASIAALFLYLNRHGFNGVCRYNKSGEFNVPFGRYKKPYFPENEILSFIAKANRADFYHAPWQKTLYAADVGDGVYCDPPYLNTFSSYTKEGFNSQEHEELAKSLYLLWEKLGVPSTVSNSICAKEIYADLGFTVHEIEAPRSIAANGTRKPAKEIIAVLR